MTTRLYLDICEGLTSTRSLSDIAKQNCVTEAIVQSVLDVVDFEQPSTLPQTLCIDEFKGSAGIYDSARKRWITDKFHCNISDGDAGCIIDILPQITLEQLMPYFFSFDLAQRQKNTNGAYACRPGTDLTGKRILLVDDIITSGSTVSACALALLAAGAVAVDAVCIAAAEDLPREKQKPKPAKRKFKENSHQ